MRLLALLLAGCATAKMPSPEVLSRRAQTVRIEARCGKLAWSGSGIAVGRTTVWTAGHLIPGYECQESPIFFAHFEGGGTKVLLLQSVDRVGDVAIMVALGGFGREWPTAIGQVEVGDQVCVVAGAPVRRVKCGVVLSTRRALPGDIAHTATTIRGNSGSGLYDSRGRLVGIVNYHTRTGGLATSVAWWRRGPWAN